MTDLFLIAHKVRGEPAFDVAARMDCPLCAGHGHDLDGVCHECDSTGYWWIIPTSGHRAFPWWNHPLKDVWMVGDASHEPICSVIDWPDPMPSNLPDHYPTRATPDAPKLNLTALMPKAEPIRRRV